MARGKYATRSSIKREEMQVSETIESYKNAVVRLTKERDDAKVRLEKVQGDLLREIKVLKALLSNNVAPEVDALHNKHNALFIKYENIRKKLRQKDESMQKLADRCTAALVADGWDYFEAIDFVDSSTNSFKFDANVRINVGKGHDAKPRRSFDPDWVKRFESSLHVFSNGEKA